MNFFLIKSRQIGKSNTNAYQILHDFQKIIFKINNRKIKIKKILNGLIK
jgi:hypothetical protein